MKNDSTQFNLNANLNLDDEFDPLEDLEPDEEDDDAGEYTATIGSPEGSAISSEVVDTRPAEERLAELMSHMAPRRQVLLGIMDFCRKPQSAAQVNNLVDQLQENNFSVYSAANLCTLLEKAGALHRQTADGDSVQEAEIAEPELVEIDGVEYFETKEPVVIYWLTTDAGLAAVEADKPLDRLMSLLDEAAQYKPLYKRILTLCAAAGGTSTAALSTAVDSDPLVQKPRLYAPYFIDRLEKCDALTWKKSWNTTDIGEAGLKALADIVDDTAIIEIKEA